MRLSIFQKSAILDIGKHFTIVFSLNKPFIKIGKRI